MIKQLKNYFYEKLTTFTISPPNFLPMIVTTKRIKLRSLWMEIKNASMLSREQVEALETEIGESIPYCRKGIHHERISDQYCRSVYTWVFYDPIDI